MNISYLGGRSNLNFFHVYVSFISLSTTDTDLEYSSTSQGKRKQPDMSDNENIAFKKGKTIDDDNV